MPKLCIFVPGLFGSRLVEQILGVNVLVWVDRLQLATGGFRRLRLSPDGVTPYESSTGAINPLGALPPYYDLIQSVFAQQLDDAGYDLLMVGYDWRKSIFRTGAALASVIQQQSAKYDTIALVGHSMGGLLSRRAWQGLASIGAAGPIKRIVTLGTPHLGSWAPAAAFAQATDYVPQLLLIAGEVTSLLTLGILGITLPEVLRVMSSWPSMYELLPVATDAQLNTPFVQAVYTASSWPKYWNIQQSWLDWSKGPYRAWVLDQSGIPPYEVLTTVCGTGTPTALGWKAADELGNPDLLRVEGNGDGVVLADRALLPGAAPVAVQYAHQSMPEDMSLSGQLIRLVTAVRAPAPPPYPVVALPGAPGVRLPGPPLATTGLRTVDP